MRPAFTFFSLFFLFLACSKPSGQKLMVATAANMQYAIDEIQKEFEKETGIQCEIILGSSGKLTAQIKEGAPYDVFVSADTKYPSVLFEEGFSLEPPFIYAYGKLVLWSLTVDSLSIHSLVKESVRHLAVANPKTAPYGQATFEFLENEKLLTALQPKMVLGESISQTNQFITTGAAEAGFTSKSVVLSPDWIGKGAWVAIDEDKYTPIAQALLILKKTEKGKEITEEFTVRNENAKAFYNFMSSQTARAVLEKSGYGIPN
jgi:molybdate transport system substrate-binding protein